MKRSVLLTVLGLAMAVCAMSSVYAETPSVVSTSPAGNVMGVPLDASISVVFDAQMDSTTVNDSTLIVTGSQTGRRKGVVSYQSSGNCATFNPRDDFVVGEVVNVRLTVGMKSTTGDSLENGHSWSFSVVTFEGPTGFGPTTGYDTGEWSHSVEACDMDGDFDIDIVGTDYYGNRVFVLANDGTGSFSMYSNCDIGCEPMSLTVDDFDNDGDQDIAASCMAAGSIAIISNIGAGILNLDTLFVSSEKAQWIEGADLDNDGDIDLATANNSPPDNISVYLNDGSGVFAHSADYPSGDVAYALCTADLENDGDADIVTVNVRDANISVFINDGTGLFAPAVHYVVGLDPYHVCAADFDGDGFLDLATANGTSDDVSILLNDGNAAFTETARLQAGNPPFVLAFDIDGDSDMDLAAGNMGYFGVFLYINDGTGSFTAADFPWVGGNHKDLSTADFDNDSDLDLVIAQSLTENIAVSFNQAAIAALPAEFNLTTFEDWPDPSDAQFEIRGSVSELSFELSESSDWLSVTPVTGSPPCTASISFDMSTLTEGEYADTIAISSDEAENSPVHVCVHVTVYPGGTLPPDFIRLAVDSVAAGTYEAELPFYVQRLCPEPLNIMGVSNGFEITATGDASWSFAGYQPDPVANSWFTLGGLAIWEAIDGVSPDTFLVLSPWPESRGGMPITEERLFFNLFLDIGSGTGEILFDSAFVGSAGAWKFSGLTCGLGGAPDRPLFLANDYTNSNQPIPIKIYRATCGDADLSGSVDIDDAVYLINHIFLGGPPPPMDAGDVDCSGGIDIDDAVLLINYIFSGGNEPCDTDGDGSSDC